MSFEEAQPITTPNSSQGRLRLNHLGSCFCSLTWLNIKESLFGVFIAPAHAQLQPEKDIQSSRGTDANRRALMSSLNLSGKFFCSNNCPKQKQERNPTEDGGSSSERSHTDGALPCKQNQFHLSPSHSQVQGHTSVLFTLPHIVQFYIIWCFFWDCTTRSCPKAQQ